LIVLIFAHIKKDYIFKMPIEIVPLILFIGMVMLSTAFSQYKYQAFWGRPLRWEGALTYAAYFLILYFSFLAVKGLREARIIITCILFSAALISIYSIMQYMGIDPIPRDAIRKIWDFQSFATMGNPNFLGTYLTITFSISLCLFFLTSGRKVPFLFISSILIYSALVCSRTRSAWVGTAFSMLIFIIIFHRKIPEFIHRILVFTAAAVLMTVLLNNIHDGLISAKFNSLISDYKSVVSSNEDKSSVGSQRIFIWNRSLSYMLDEPLLGSGPDTFDRVFKMTPQEANHYFGAPNIFVDKAHNEYLQIIITLGFPALMFYLCFILIMLYKTFKTIINKEYDVLQVCLFISIIGYITQAFFNISVVSVAPLYWSNLGILLALNNMSSYCIGN
jgi:putative inorganic carbon (HCO3(-)) transporter